MNIKSLTYCNDITYKTISTVGGFIIGGKCYCSWELMGVFLGGLIIGRILAEALYLGGHIYFWGGFIVGIVRLTISCPIIIFVVALTLQISLLYLFSVIPRLYIYFFCMMRFNNSFDLFCSQMFCFALLAISLHCLIIIWKKAD